MAAPISPTLDPAETTTPINDREGPSAVVDQSPERREGGAGGAGGVEAEEDDEGDEEEGGRSPEEAVSGRKWGHKKALQHGYS